MQVEDGKCERWSELGVRMWQIARGLFVSWSLIHTACCNSVSILTAKSIQVLRVCLVPKLNSRAVKFVPICYQNFSMKACLSNLLTSIEKFHDRMLKFNCQRKLCMSTKLLLSLLNGVTYWLQTSSTELLLWVKFIIRQTEACTSQFLWAFQCIFQEKHFCYSQVTPPGCCKTN